MKKEYYWWDLDESKFKAILYDSINIYFLHDHPYKNWDEFVKIEPHMAYAHLIYVRFHSLEQQFVDLRVIPQMLGVQNIPLKSILQDINRYDWLKSIVDLSLYRFSSIRDIVFHFVNQVLELNIPDHILNIKQLSKIIKNSHPEIFNILKILENSGSTLRLERNDRAHKGFYNLYTDDDEMFKNMSWSEQTNSKIVGYDLVAVYEASRDKIYSIFVEEVEKIFISCNELLNELYPFYRDKYKILSENSKSGPSPHFKNYHMNHA
ncbi:Cthe_2314 family HEPN domain-containing protein [Gilliamella sp. ESL0254]|uniref:Cthe_2314 family HEPN domain-containing protein n=1 Tax=Gilliamella sp. ESL0254 TaxID=2705035 RepID=UPI001581299B|nr:Cthe_2314 family HEPN domain-containing protein [Gilliamella sp. ESL0254]NUF26998.1 hypothetical protein [Gilliamella sp. ESL0254]